MNKIVYFDMDGVLCDFIKRVEEISGKTIRELNDQDGDPIASIIQNEIQNGLFETLPLMKNADELIRFIHDLSARGFDVQILTCVGLINPQEVIKQKRKWLEDNGLGFLKFNHVYDGRHKQFYANENAFLVDDTDSVVELFALAGGNYHHYHSISHGIAIKRVSQFLDIWIETNVIQYSPQRSISLNNGVNVLVGTWHNIGPINPKRIPLYVDTVLRVAEESYAVRLKVGAIMVDNNRIASYGFNGTGPGEPNVCEHDVAGVLKTHDGVLHAEENAILNMANSPDRASEFSMVVSHAPCYKCAGKIIRSGIKSVYFVNTYKDSVGIRRLLDAGVNVYQAQQQVRGTYYTLKQIVDTTEIDNELERNIESEVTCC